MQRWTLILSAYDYDLEFRKLERHGNADALSRFKTSTAADVDAEDSATCYSMDLFQDSALVFEECRLNGIFI